jgi:hypothetical protein
MVAVQWQYVLQSVQQCVYWVVCSAQHPVHTLQPETHTATTQQHF